MCLSSATRDNYCNGCNTKWTYGGRDVTDRCKLGTTSYWQCPVPDTDVSASTRRVIKVYCYNMLTINWMEIRLKQLVVSLSIYLFIDPSIDPSIKSHIPRSCYLPFYGSIYRSTDPSTHISIHRSIYPCIHQIHRSVDPMIIYWSSIIRAIHPPIDELVDPPMNPCNHSSIDSSTHPSSHVPIVRSFDRSIDPSFHQSTHPSILAFIYLSVHPTIHHPTIDPSSHTSLCIFFLLSTCLCVFQF